MRQLDFLVARHSRLERSRRSKRWWRAWQTVVALGRIQAGKRLVPRMFFPEDLQPERQKPPATPQAMRDKAMAVFAPIGVKRGNGR